ncbi:MAG: hypothetical protein U9N42_02740 [Campylobacterota bacterium]|nr:hypothetical protein [Campylobacterota bacterium]
MVNIDDLEKRLFRYKLNRAIPCAAMIFLTTLLISITFWFFNKESQENRAVEPKIEDELVIVEKKSFDEKNVTKKVVPKKELEPKIDEIKTKITITPMMNFLNDFEYYHSEKRELHVETIPDDKVIVTNKKAPKEIVEIKEKVIKKNISNTITKADIESVINRFEKNKNPKLSLFVAKYYYDKKNYEKAYEYALITNELDSTLEESWIIFASSQVKLHQKSKAVSTLKNYISHSHSQKATILLDDIINGDFK